MLSINLIIASTPFIDKVRTHYRFVLLRSSMNKLGKLQVAEMKKNPMKTPQGVTFMEVLVALFLLSITVSSSAFFQTKSVFATQEALWRNHAAIIAQDLLARRELNPAGWGDKSNFSTMSCLTSLPCRSPSDLAKQDIEDVSAYVASMLPNGQLALSMCGSSASSCIKIAWGKMKVDECQRSRQLHASDFNRASDLYGSQCLVVDF